MKKTYNWGILATGKIAATFASAVNFVPDAKLYACASRTLDKAEAFAKKHGVKVAYGSYEELANDPNVDVIYIASPMSCHYENAKMCLEHGKAVLCEKSVTLNTAQFLELIALARLKNLFFMEAMWMKCRPTFRKAKEWIDGGKIGEVRAIRADFSQPAVFDPNDRLYRPDLGGGALLDLGVYCLTLTTAFLGCEPESISSSVNIDRLGVDMDEVLTLQYKNAYSGMTAGFDIEDDNRAVIVGTNGRVAFTPDLFFRTAYRCSTEAAGLSNNVRFPTNSTVMNMKLKKFKAVFPKDLPKAG